MEPSDIVRLGVDLSASVLQAGRRGVIVDVHPHPPGFEVEWLNADGEPAETLGIVPDLTKLEAETAGVSIAPRLTAWIPAPPQ